MKILHSVSFILGLALTSASYAEQFAIDPLRSHIEIDLQSWVQGDPWGFIDPESGELSVMGYELHVETQTMRYAVSGSFELIDASLSQDSFAGINLVNVDLQADTPLPWQLSLPAALAYDTLTGNIAQRGNWVSHAQRESIATYCTLFCIPLTPRRFLASAMATRFALWACKTDQMWGWRVCTQEGSRRPTKFLCLLTRQFVTTSSRQRCRNRPSTACCLPLLRWFGG